MADWQRIADFDCIVETGKDDNICVVLFHGYGASADDLYPLCKYLDPEGKINWVFPQGPQEVILGPGMTGRAWFDIDIAALEEAMKCGGYRDLAAFKPSTLDSLVGKSIRFSNNLQNLYSKVILGGFSQGSMLAIHTTLKSEQKPQALVILSGTPIDEAGMRNSTSDLQGIPFFQSHGNNDALLNPKDAIKLFQILKEAGMEGKLFQFKGGHEIPPSILAELKKFMDANTQF